MSENTKKMTMDDLKEVVKSTVQPEVTASINEYTKAMSEELDKKFKEFSDSVDKRISVGDEPLDKDPKGGFKTLSEFGKEVWSAGRGNLSKTMQSWVAKAAGTPSQNISDNEAGAYLIPPEWNAELMKPITQEDLAFSRTRKVYLQRNTIEMPYVNGFDESSGKVYGNVQVTWMDEEEQHTAGSLKFGKMRLNLKKLGLLAYVTDEIIQDSPSSMEVILRDSFRDALTYELNDKLLRGTGAGQPQGILNAPAIVTVSAESGQLATTILFENILKMYARISDRSRAIWMANPNTLPQLATMSLAVGTGGIPVFMPANGAAGRPFDTLFGLPIVWNKHCSTLGTVGDIILVDWSQYYVALKAGNEGGNYSSSVHLKFDYDQTAFKFVFRIDGQCAWKSAITPPQATSDTISPIVVLATRS